MPLVFGFLVGLLTLTNPCVLPALPLALASARQAHRLGPVTLAAGMATSFVIPDIGIAAAGRSLGRSGDGEARAGAPLMMGFGLIMLVPRFKAGFAATG